MQAIPAQAELYGSAGLWSATGVDDGVADGGSGEASQAPVGVNSKQPLPWPFGFSLLMLTFVESAARRACFLTPLSIS
jgi:hypothetical protein